MTKNAASRSMPPASRRCTHEALATALARWLRVDGITDLKLAEGKPEEQIACFDRAQRRTEDTVRRCAVK
jgi:hypothetical protein